MSELFNTAAPQSSATTTASTPLVNGKAPDKPTGPTLNKWCVVAMQATGRSSIVGWHSDTEADAITQADFFRALYQGVKIIICRVIVDLQTPQPPSEDIA